MPRNDDTATDFVHPVGIDCLLGMAATSDELGRQMMERREDTIRAAVASGVALSPVEQAILATIEDAPLALMIQGVKRGLSVVRRRIFLQHTAKVLASLLAGTAVAGQAVSCRRQAPTPDERRPSTRADGQRAAPTMPGPEMPASEIPVPPTRSGATAPPSIAPAPRDAPRKKTPMDRGLPARYRDSLAVRGDDTGTGLRLGGVTGIRPGSSVGYGDPRKVDPDFGTLLQRPVPVVSYSKPRVLSGDIQESVVARVLRRNRPGLTSCHSLALQDDAKATGDVQVTLTITRLGQVGRLSLSSTLKSAAANQALRRLIGRWRFPKPSGRMPLISFTVFFRLNSRYPKR